MQPRSLAQWTATSQERLAGRCSLQVPLPHRLQAQGWPLLQGKLDNPSCICPLKRGLHLDRLEKHMGLDVASLLGPGTGTFQAGE